MITIPDSDSLSRLLFLSDLYEMVLGVQGGIIHVGARDDDGVLWDSLHKVYEPMSGRRWLTRASCKGVIEYFKDHASYVTALVYFDDTAGQENESVKNVLGVVVPYLVRGSVVAFNRLDIGEQLFAVNEVLGLNNLALQKWHPGRRDCYAVV